VRGRVIFLEVHLWYAQVVAASGLWLEGYTSSRAKVSDVNRELVLAEMVLAGRRAQIAVEAQVRAAVLERRRERRESARLARQTAVKVAFRRYRRKG
jgi:hypothetical protein